MLHCSLDPSLRKADGFERLPQGPQAQDQVILGRDLAGACVFGGYARGGETSLGLDDVEYVVHQLRGKPFGYVDGIGLVAQQAPVRLEPRALPLGIALRFLGMLLDKQLQGRLLELLLELFGAQRRGLLGSGVGRCGGWRGSDGWRRGIAARFDGAGGRWLFVDGLCGLGAWLGSDRRCREAAGRVGGGLLLLLGASHGRARTGGADVVEQEREGGAAV